jgi:hypothetical protein
MTHAGQDEGRRVEFKRVVHARLLSRAAWLRRWGLTALLLALIVMVFVVPALAAPAETTEVVIDFFFTIVLVAGVVAVAERRITTYVLALLCAAAIATRWTEWLVPGRLLLPVRQTTALFAVVILAAMVGKSVFAPGRVTIDRIMGAIVLYLLIGIAFAVAYQSVEAHVPGAFAGTPKGTGGLDRWGYFSFVTMTTVGYGDITPVANIARALATFEAFVGQLYPAVILARLVSLQIVRSPDDT